MMFVFGGRRYALLGGTFEHTYRCLPPSSASNHPHLEDGDKVLLPPSALHRLTSLHVDYPMLFKLSPSSPNNQPPPRASHCGVLEFVATEGTVVMPRWMMSNLGINEGDNVTLKSAAGMPKCTYVKIQPHTAAFLDVSNPKAVLEKTLRAFTCLTTGDTIMVGYNNRSYYIDIVETKPAAAVCIIDTDCEVDFAPPLDYKEPDEKPVRIPAPAVVVPASGKKRARALADDDDTVVVKGEPNKFKAFAGSGKRLDGKASALEQASLSEGASTVACSASAPSGSNGGKKQQASSAASSSGRHKTGKIVFGSSSAASNSKEERHKAAVKQAEEPTKKDEPMFQAFTGKSYSLKR